MKYDLDPYDVIVESSGFKFINSIVNNRYKKYNDLLSFITISLFKPSNTFLGRFAYVNKNMIVLNLFVDPFKPYPIDDYRPELLKSVRIYNFNEAMIFCFGHEFAHVLQFVKKGRLNETSASRFALKLLKIYRKQGYQNGFVQDFNRYF